MDIVIGLILVVLVIGVLYWEYCLFWDKGD